MKNMIILMVILLFSQVVISYAGDDDIGRCTAEFLKIGQGPRIVGMGGAGVAIADDVNATYWNPAGLVQLKSRELTAARTRWFEDIKTDYIAYSQPLLPIDDRKRAIGVKLILLNVGGIDGRDNRGQKTTSLEVDNLALSLSYAIELLENIAFGFNVKTIRQDFGGNKGTGMAVDIGFFARYTEKTSFGLNIQNIGPKLKTAKVRNALPFNIKLGTCYKAELLGQGTLLALDVDIPRDNDFNFRTGIEYWLTQFVSIRLGYDRQTGFSTGLGFRSKGEGYFEGVEVQVDYGFISHVNFDNSHRFSFITKF